ncbi:MAG: coaE operon protein [Euryarchaeota archaeon]|nr:coaE operon protein [Euryarchaeota archaeon]
MPHVRVEVPVYPTESVAKVKLACLNLFPDLAFREERDALVGEAASLEKFRELVRNQKIRDTARDVLIKGRQGNLTSFRLSKQAAFVGRVNFAAPAPLGDIHVTVEDEDLDALIDYVAASTVGHRLVKPNDRSEGT